MSTFDPSILLTPVAVNPQANWRVRINIEDAKVDFKGLAQELGLDVNGLNYGLHPTRNQVLIWPAPKADSMVLKGKGMSGKMVTLIDFLRKAGEIQENHEIVFCDISDFDEDPNYKVLTLDNSQKNVVRQEEPADADIEDAVEANV